MTNNNIENVNGIWIPKGDKFFKKSLAQERIFKKNHILKAFEYMNDVDYTYAYDIGAHVGTWSVFLSGYFHKVVAFEPCKLNYECLVKNTANLNNVMTYNLAVSNVHKEDEVLYKGYRNTGMHYLKRETNIDESLHTSMEYVNTIPLNDLHRLNPSIEDPTFIKIDVEGHEYEVLKGMNTILSRFKGVLVVEEGPNTHPDKVPSEYLMSDYGFEKVYTIGEDVILVRE